MGSIPGRLAAVSAAAAAIHLAAMGEHLSESLLFAAFFAAVALFQAAWAVGILRSPSVRLVVAGAVANAAVVGIWILSRTAGLPVGPDPGVAESLGAADLLATALEVALVAGSLIVLARPAAAKPKEIVARSVMRSTSILTVVSAGALAFGGHPGHAAHHALHLTLVGGAAALFGVYLALFVWVNGRPAFSWRLRPEAEPFT